MGFAAVDDVLADGGGEVELCFIVIDEADGAGVHLVAVAEGVADVGELLDVDLRLAEAAVGLLDVFLGLAEFFGELVTALGLLRGDVVDREDSFIVGAPHFLFVAVWVSRPLVFELGLFLPAGLSNAAFSDVQG